MKMKNIIQQQHQLCLTKQAQVENLEQDKKVRKNQILELIKFFEQDQIQIDIAQQLSYQLEHVTFDLSLGDNTREYRNRLYSIKIRLNGTKGQFIRSVLLQGIMIPLELMVLDMSKLNEISIQSFLESNNRQFPYKNISNIQAQKIVVNIDITQNTQGTQLESIDLLKITSQKEYVEVENYNYFNQNKSTDLMVTQIQSEIILKQTESLQTKSTIIETEKQIFFNQRNPYHNLKNSQIIFEYNKKQRDFFEHNDFPNIQELQINQIIQNNQQENQFANSLLNQEFLIDEPQDALKQMFKQVFYILRFKKRNKNKNEIFEDQVNYQLAEFATQIYKYQSNHNQSLNNETQNISTHKFEQQVYQKRIGITFS
ncbi:unnamed protein product [Paramecium primaurelia]|uniref:TFIIS central domain-containing protein n=1 Tax=Paramecium primaurelia TaxID=5886 RepID=A0A8S1M345_PARPR|nr:unnamed protein product [Paramecium primaurelia]